MRILISIGFLLQLGYASVLYEGGGFALHLQDDGHFRLYPNEQALKVVFAGNYLERNDSIILTTHQFEGESVIMAIYASEDSLKLDNSYVQNEYREMLPTQLYLSKKYYSNGSIHREYFWSDYSEQNFYVYAFSPNKRVLAISPYRSGLKEGKEILFFNDSQNAVQAERNYIKGNLSGKSFYYERIGGNELQVKLVRIEKYRKGEIIKTKTLAAPPVFYTSHF